MDINLALCKMSSMNSETDPISEKSKFTSSELDHKEVQIKFADENLNLQKLDLLDLSEGDCNEKTTKGKLKVNTGFRAKYGGIILAILSALVLSLGALIVKYMNAYHPFTIAVFRLQGILLPSILIVSCVSCGQKRNIFEPVWPVTQNSNWKNVAFLLLRGITGCTGLILQYYSLKYLTIADVMTISCIKPVLVTFVAHVLLGETWGLFSIFVAILTILGIGIILRPPMLTGSESFDPELLIGAAYALGSVLVTTFNITIIRHCRKIHFSVVLLSFSISGTIMSLILSLSFGVFVLPQENNDILYAIALAAIAFLVQILTVFSLKKEQAGIVSVAKTTQIVFAIFWQMVLLGVMPDIFSLLGAGIVIMGVGLTAWSKWISTLSADHPARKRYCFVLK